jgi:putative zinc finger/helix-turn-helix YgiT family protein
MKGICPNCEKQTELEVKHATEDVVVRGESIPVAVEYYKCLACGEEFEDPGSHDDPLDKAYREYRKRHSMLQPEEINALRKRYGLTQNEMSRLLGWGGATLSRYENGALQDDAHEKTLRLITEPHNLLRLIEESPDTLTEEKRKHLIEQLRGEEGEAYSFARIYEERFGSYEADEFSGYRRFDLAKLVNAILFFCKDTEGRWKTVLNKLLFYADFKHCKEYTVSITGSRYARIPYGPAPDNWTHYLALLIEEGALRVEEVYYPNDVIGERLVAEKKPDLALFSDTELKILASVKEDLKDWSAKKVSDFSHDEKGYIETPGSRLISYTYAKDLQI